MPTCDHGKWHSYMWWSPSQDVYVPADDSWSKDTGSTSLWLAKSDLRSDGSGLRIDFAELWEDIAQWIFKEYSIVYQDPNSA